LFLSSFGALVEKLNSHFMIRTIFVAIGIVLITSCNDKPSTTESITTTEPAVSNEPPAIAYTVINATPHDTTSYTEGFLMHDGKIFESSGAPEDMPNTRSIVGIVDRATGEIHVKAELDRSIYFGEGITILNDKLYMLTWKNQKGFIYNAKTFKKEGEFSFPTKEGWGMTTDGKYLILSDGSSNLTYLDPATFKTVKIIGVTDNNGPVGNINELEYVNGNILANIYFTNYIIRIDPNSGKVTGKADFSSLKKEAENKYSGSEYMNGIAYDSAKKSIFVTGKLWPNIFEVRLNN
jgi:glutaminyl-peptide cyclotransferase